MAQASTRSKRPRNHDNDEYSTIHVPFLDADADGELPLAQLDEFIVPGSDEKGRKVTVSCNIPPMLDRQIDVILAARRFPYANKKDFIRHAIARQVAWIIEIRSSIPQHYLAMFESALEVVRDDEAAMRHEQVLLTLNERITDHIAKGESGEALRLISNIDQKLRRLKSSMWVRRFAERFYSRYSGWLKSANPSANIGTSNANKGARV